MIWFNLHTTNFHSQLSLSPPSLSKKREKTDLYSQPLAAWDRAAKSEPFYEEINKLRSSIVRGEEHHEATNNRNLTYTLEDYPGSPKTIFWMYVYVKTIVLVGIYNQQFQGSII